MAVSTSSSKILCVTDLVLKQFIVRISLFIVQCSNLIYGKFQGFCLQALIAIHLTHNHSDVNTELTIA